jgi:hypothetical protein
VFQLLSVTCDNAANNDTMIKHLSTLVDDFPGAPNQTRCFSHILNLVAKSILRQFDVAKNSGPVDSELDDAMKELVVLARELDLGPNDGGVDEDDDGEEKYEDEEEKDGDDDGQDDNHGMSEEELADLQASLEPIRLMLTKVGSFLNSILNLLTVHSFGRSQTPSRIPRPFSSLIGTRSSRILVSASG